MTQTTFDYAGGDSSALTGYAGDDVDPYAGDVIDQGGLLAGPRIIPRSKWIAAPFLLPLILCAISYASGGVQFLNDVSFIILIVICCAYVVRELLVFPYRFGFGALIAFGGTLAWFCYDYVKHWMGIDRVSLGVEKWVLAKAAMYHMLFVFFMAVGLQIRWGRWLSRALAAVPEPSNRNVYFLVVLVLFAIGMIPLVFFSSEGFFVTVYKSIFAGRSGQGAMFTAGRTGNVNYNWGGYIAQLSDIGMMGAVLAAFHAILVTRSILQKVICWAIWALWMALSFGTGTRGFVLFVGMPVVMLLFLKYNYQAAAAMKRVSIRAYVIGFAIGTVFLILIQIQGDYRTQGFHDVEEVEVSDLKGNEMFTTTLVGMSLIPDNVPYLCNRFTGEGLIRALPEAAYWFLIGPIPRAMWHDKPIDPIGAWYSDTVTGEHNGDEGTTISGGAVGTWYFKFGPWGVVQMGLLYGWMMRAVEESLRKADGRPMGILFSLAFGTFMFRGFRDLWWHNLYPVIIGGVVMYLFVRTFNTLFGGGGAAAAHVRPAMQ
jgi:oligosaccharide repeat unit polymerase